MHLETTFEISTAKEHAFAWIRSVEAWPVLFQPNIYAERICTTQLEGLEEKLSMCALVGEGVRQWRSSRTIDDQQFLIKFHQTHGNFPIESMHGEWRVTGIGSSCRVTLSHDVQFSTDSTAADQQWVAEQTSRNSERELSALARACDSEESSMENFFAVDDVIDVPDAASTLEWIWNAHLWPERVEHIKRVMIDDMGDGAQLLRLDLTGDVQTESIRVRNGDQIWYKQTRVPAGLVGHAGLWKLRDSTSLRTRHMGLLDRRDPNLTSAPTAIQDWKRTFVTNSRATVASQGDGEP